jgi:Spy/CpxP family protein refolding chaperone
MAAALMFGIALLFAGSAAAADVAADGTDLEGLRSKETSDKRALVESTLKLTPKEAKKFWRIYDAYQRDLDEAGRMQGRALEGLIGRERAASDKYANQLARDLMLADRTEFDGRVKMQRAVMRALPPRKAARYMQLESKLRALHAYDIAKTFPLVQ